MRAKDTNNNGVHVVLPSSVAIAGHSSSAGSAALAGYKAPADATLVWRLRQGGYKVATSNAMSEFGLGLGETSIATAIGTEGDGIAFAPDLLGEGRLAAVTNGLCGFKPSYGALSRFGMAQLMPSLESLSIITAGPDKITKVLETVTGDDPQDPSLPADSLTPNSADMPGTPSLGIIDESLAELQAADSSAFNNFVESLENLGCTIRRLSLQEFALFKVAHQIIGAVEAASATGRYDSVRYGKRPAAGASWNEMYLQARGAAFGPLLKSLLVQGAYFQFKARDSYDNACRIRGRLVKQVEALMQEIDALLLPLPMITAGKLANIDELYTTLAATLFGNITGQPVLALPPAGERPALQLAGARLSDYKVLKLGNYLLEATQK